MYRFKLLSICLWNFLFFKMKRNKLIKTAFKIFISPKTEIQIDKGSSFIAERYTKIERGTYIAVRPGAKITFGQDTFVNRNCCIVAHQSIEIGAGVSIGPNCCIYDHDHDLYKRGKYNAAPIVINDNVWIASGVIILKGVTIGKNSVIAAGSVITRDVPDNTIVYQKRTNTYKKK